MHVNDARTPARIVEAFGQKVIHLADGPRDDDNVLCVSHDCLQAGAWARCDHRSPVYSVPSSGSVPTLASAVRATVGDDRRELEAPYLGRPACQRYSYTSRRWPTVTTTTTRMSLRMV